jgi:hypothetical protein
MLSSTDSHSFVIGVGEFQRQDFVDFRSKVPISFPSFYGFIYNNN